ncbi:hypothetical protein LRAMOSA00082 [Lichtheimia ramosa]|uniref:Microtubule associated protein n=1 Tax=Lichtheimia ramosa TaxID=688394 RepID=A0A077W5M8_9FUNG|nr:hypothetical protein LRAMOSA00082 [Lichtheimia ramosa]
MECLDAKINKLYNLWTTMGMPMDDISVTERLQYVLAELDRLLNYEDLRRKLLCADIEDRMASIEESCSILGVALENVLTSELCKDALLFDNQHHLPLHSDIGPTFAKQEALMALDSKLTSEIHERRIHMKKWLRQINKITAELDEPNPLPPYETYENELSWATVQSISCALRDLLEKQSSRQQAFEPSARTIHFCWTILDVAPDRDDPMDMALVRLFTKVPLQVDRENLTLVDSGNKDTFPYYNNVSRNGIPLRSATNVAILEAKAKELQDMYDTRLALYNKYVKSIRTIWEELSVPDHQRCTIVPSLSSKNLERLHREFDRLKTIVRDMAEDYIDKFREKLEDLWDKALLTQRERAEFISRLHEKADTMDQVHLLVDEHMKYLQRVQPKAILVAKIMKQRNDLIQEMINFEKNASDPKRLFQASFQLLQEERWRNSCFPNLLQLDDALFKAVREFEYVSGKPFIYGQRRYLDTLRDEIADRAANQTFFGFLKSSEKNGKHGDRRVKPYMARTASSTTTMKRLMKGNPPSPSSSSKTRRSKSKTTNTSLSSSTASHNNKATNNDNDTPPKMPPTPPAELLAFS